MKRKWWGEMYVIYDVYGVETLKCGLEIGNSCVFAHDLPTSQVSLVLFY